MQTGFIALAVSFFLSSANAAEIQIYAPADLKKGVQERLATISSYRSGRALLDAIRSSRHSIKIFHNPSFCESAGAARAPMKDALTNREGAWAEVHMDLTVPEDGSHWVTGEDGEKLEYTAVQNLFHELVHAKHYMLGTWHYWRSEQQAVDEENVFRREQAQRAGSKARERYYHDGDGELRISCEPNAKNMEKLGSPKN